MLNCHFSDSVVYQLLSWKSRRILLSSTLCANCNECKIQSLGCTQAICQPMLPSDACVGCGGGGRVAFMCAYAEGRLHQYKQKTIFRQTFCSDEWRHFLAVFIHWEHAQCSQQKHMGKEPPWLKAMHLQRLANRTGMQRKATSCFCSSWRCLVDHCGKQVLGLDGLLAWCSR